jgi:hypothetical protein
MITVQAEPEWSKTPHGGAHGGVWAGRASLSDAGQIRGSGSLKKGGGSMLMNYLHCVPSDFMNPFVPLAVQVSVCAGLLMLGALFGLPRIVNAQHGVGVRRVQQGIGAAELIAGCGALILAVRIWNDAQRYIPWCIPVLRGPLGDVQLRTLDQDTALAWLAVAVTLAAILISFAALVVVRFLKRRYH